jgi:uncharacterized protein YjbI with pentapeptide repeats
MSRQSQTQSIPEHSMESAWMNFINDATCRAHQLWVVAGRVGPGRLDLEEADLRGAVVTRFLPGCRLVRCDLSDARIRIGRLQESELIHCRLDGAKLDVTRFDGATIIECTARRALLQFAGLQRAIIRKCDFSASDLDRVEMAEALVSGVSFTRCLLSDAQLDGARFTDCDFRGADMRSLRRNVHGASAAGAHFVRCDFRGVRFDGWRLCNTVFDHCALHGISGTPIIEGPVSMIDPDLSDGHDGSEVIDGAVLVAGWCAARVAPRAI